MCKQLFFFLFLFLNFLHLTAQDVVTSSADSGMGSLRQVVADANSGSVITFAIVTGNDINLTSGEIIIDKNLRIEGDNNTGDLGNSANITINGSRGGRIFNITAGNVTIQDINLTGGLADNGGAIKVANANLTLENAFLDNNEANGAMGSGGAILNDVGATLTVNNSTIMNNAAVRAGGGIEDNSGTGLGITLNNVTLNNNTTGSSPGNGGGLHITGAGDAMITGGTVNSNRASAEGGGLWNGTGTMTINGTTINGNTASGNDATNGGGGVFNNSGTVNISGGAAITNNTADGDAGSGGGIFNETNGNLMVTNSMITGNTANRAGGGIEDNAGANGSLQLIIVTMNNNSTTGSAAMNAPGNGGGLHITGAGNASIIGGAINGNTAAAEGGGLWNGTGTMTVDGVTIDGNTASGDDATNGGGGIFNNGGTLMVMAGTNINNNRANGESGSGGGIFSTNGTVNIMGSATEPVIIQSNLAVRAGGAIEVIDGTVNVNHTNMIGNDVAGVLFTSPSPNPGNGGGIHVTGTNGTMVNIIGGMINTNQAASEGGGLWNQVGSTMTVNGTSINANVAMGNTATEGGGGIFNNGGTLVVENSTNITNNRATGTAGSGGGIFNETDGMLTITDSSITGNESNRAGGGIEDNSGNATTMQFTNIALNNNRTGVVTATGAPGNGGGLHITGPGNVDMIGGSVSNNTAASEGGGLWNGSRTMNVQGVTINNNIASGADADNGGGGIFNNGGTLNVTSNSVVSNNQADGTSGSGGGIFSTAGTVTVTNSSVTGNAANRAGGGIELVDGNLIFTDSNLTDNDVNGTSGTANPGNGGGFHKTGQNGNSTFTTSRITGNAAAREGGGLWNQTSSSMNVIASTVDNNTAGGINTENGGGGIFNNGGTLFVILSTISNNAAEMNGGGIHVKTGTLTLFRSTISGNETKQLPGSTNTGLMRRGGGIYSTGTSLNIDVSTIAKNMADGNGGGIDLVSGTASLKNTILADNTALIGQNLNGSDYSSEGFNLIGADEGNNFPAIGTDIEGVDPLLMDLADNGGPTQTHAIPNNSPAVNVGGPETFADQRDAPIIGQRDIGAYESGSVALAVFALDFTATSTAAKVQLDWNIVSDTEVVQFVVERSADGIQFTDLADVLTRTDGYYQLVDEQPLVGTNYYRLRFIFEDGTTVQSSVRLVEWSAIAKAQIMPNPITTQTVFRLQTATDIGQLNVQILDQNGKLLQQRTEVVAGQKYEQVIDLQQQPAGSYYLRFSHADQQRIIRLLKVK